MALSASKVKNNLNSPPPATQGAPAAKPTAAKKISASPTQYNDLKTAFIFQINTVLQNYPRGKDRARVLKHCIRDSQFLTKCVQGHLKKIRKTEIAKPKLTEAQKKEKYPTLFKWNDCKYRAKKDLDIAGKEIVCKKKSAWHSAAMNLFKTPARSPKKIFH